MGSSPCHTEQRRKVSAHAEVSRNFLKMHYAPFHRAWLIKFSADRVETNKNVNRERERDGERERQMGKWGGGGKRKRD